MVIPADSPVETRRRRPKQPIPSVFLKYSILYEERRDSTTAGFIPNNHLLETFKASESP